MYIGRFPSNALSLSQSSETNVIIVSWYLSKHVTYMFNIKHQCLCYSWSQDRHWGGPLGSPYLRDGELRLWVLRNDSTSCMQCS